jgi:hypothetical protein
MKKGNGLKMFFFSFSVGFITFFINFAADLQTAS